MYRAAKPKLTLCTSIAQNAGRQSFCLRSPGPVASSTPYSPISSSPRSPYPPPQMYSYTNSSTAKSILKKSPNSSSSTTKKSIQFDNSPTVYCVTPIENKDEYYGGYVKMSRDERRWGIHLT